MKQDVKELSNQEAEVSHSPSTRIRKISGGRKASVKKDKKLQVAIEKLLVTTIM